MYKTHFLTALSLLIFSAAGFTSQIKKITLSELHAKADLILMAEVTEVVEDGNLDHVTIRADVFLKGKSSQTVFTFTLVTRGGLKDFDPSLKKGDTGVFFLKLGNKHGLVEKAYWGSIATFQKNHFDLTDHKAGKIPTIITSVSQPDTTAKKWLILENELYKFLRVGFGHEKEQGQGLYVFSKKYSVWLKIEQVSILNAVFGSSPTFEQCRKANVPPPSVGWDFRPFKKDDFIHMPIRYYDFVSFPNNIAFDKKTGLWILSFMSGWDIKGAKTVLKFKDADLETAFKKVKIGAAPCKIINESDLSQVTAPADSSVAINLSSSLDTWRSFRIKHGLVKNLEEYERGFRKGFTSPPRLVDGSADFNLGHSDGMLAKMKIFPNIE
ncbi:hypothetical protein H8E88_20850 [candidate division KSB1 bacterium]|nr:hypothetical protein [candidate division KSB1 bacterium]MBL7092629.1 hypothetical protein [candidate division KSB1 bacterium]